jgi:hypothetical protein
LRRLMPGPISSSPGTARLPPFIIFSTSYPKRNVRLWHKADIQLSACNVRFRG